MKFSVFGLALFGLLLFTPGIHAQSVPGFQAPEKPQPKDESVQIKAARGEAPLGRLYDYLKVESSKIKRLPALKESEKQGEASGKAFRIGTVRPLTKPLDGSSDGTLYHISEGDVRVMGVVSEGALYTRVQFKGMSLPAGARVFVYSMQNPDEFYGPYEGHGPSEDGTFWTPPMKGDGAVIEYFVPKGATNLKGTPFKVSNVTHVYINPFGDEAAGACNLEVTPEWSQVAKSVGRLDFVTPAGSFLCTGTLLNDAPSSQTPYLLTADHCISTQASAQSLRVYWNYLTGDSPPAGTPFTDGANLLAHATASDFSFLRLTGSLPSGLFFSGWSANPTSASTSVTSIHHPSGSHKRISFGTTNGNCSLSTPGPCANFTGVGWSSGTTEGGSSGSGLWIGSPANAQLVGTLWGGGASCSSPTASDFYGRFSVDYPSISNFLSGAGSCVSALNPTGQNFSASGGTGSITVTASSGCSWTVTSSDPFITITSSANGSGNGTVTFSVASNNSGQRSGVISVGAQTFIVTQAAGVCPSSPISIGQTINGMLSASDCVLSDGSFYDAYTFSGTAGQQIVISMSSSDFDTYLILLGPDGALVASNDDSIPNFTTNSRIPASSGFLSLPATGTYTILANSFAANETGSYSLTLSGSSPTIQLLSTSFGVSESSSFATITVTRGGDTTGAATVKYATSDTTDVNFQCNPTTAGQATGAASRKCDYHIAVGRLRFAPNETSKQIKISIVDDVYVEGSETFTLTLSNPTGATLGANSSATITITDNDFTAGQANPIDNTRFYVRQLYVDLLSREPDQAGWDGWTSRIDLCGQPGQAPPPCDRVTVGGDGFLRSSEFFDRQFFVLRLYRTGLGRIPNYSEVGDLAYVSGFLSSTDLESSKQELVADIMARSEFANRYNSLTNAQFVSTLLTTAGVTVPQATQDGWVTALNGNTKTRAQVFREVSERQEVSDKYLHEAQVISAYYGFFTRNPDGAYLNFLDRLNKGEINLGDLANAFINAAEYRKRFGP
jgi:hypothetical protein